MLNPKKLIVFVNEIKKIIPGPSLSLCSACGNAASAGMAV